MCIDIAEKIALLANEKKLRIAIVDKEIRLRNLLDKVMIDLGFEVFETDDAKQVVVMQFQNPFDIIAVQWNGEETGKILDAMAVLCDELPKLIIINGKDIASFSLTVSVSAFLFEPFTLEEVICAVWDAIGEKNARC